MAVKKKNLAGLAKKTTKKDVAEESTSTVEMAKKKVEELINEVTLNPQKKEGKDLLELDEKPQKNLEWLEEQITSLSEKNETLRKEIATLKTENEKLKKGGNLTDDVVKLNVIKVFNELQEHHLKLRGNFIISPVAFMNRLLLYFPFLNKLKKY